jgi:cytochrome c oxidase subunit 2
VIEFLQKLGLIPEQASTFASNVDDLFLFLVALTAFFSILIAVAVVILSVKYRQRKNKPLAAGEDTSHAPGAWILEVTWTVIPFVIAMGVFFWSASIYFTLAKPPDNALEVFVVGKQWMWKVQHMEGRREINELHIPIGKAVKLTMTSEDVIHSFYVPAFRVKFDALPNRYTTAWFQPTKEGEYHLFCAEYCGTQHSRMIGRIVVMSMADYQQWLKSETPVGAGSTPAEAGMSMTSLGERLFERNGCRTCHATSPSEGATASTGPPLYGLYGRPVPLENGSVVTADDEYLRRSIVEPMSSLVKGYRPMMPTYAGRLSEEDILRLVAFIKSRGMEMGAPGSDVAPAPGAAATATEHPAAMAEGAPPQAENNQEAPAVEPAPSSPPPAPPGAADLQAAPPAEQPSGETAPTEQPHTLNQADPAESPHARALDAASPAREES